MPISRLGRNAVYTFLSQIVAIGLGFVATRYIYTKLGGDALGLLYFSLTLNEVLNRAGLSGISSLTVREVSYNLDSQSGYLHDYIRTASLFYWGLYGLILVAVLLGTPWIIRHWVTLTELEPEYATRVLQVFLVGVLTIIPFSLYGALLRGRQDIGYISLVNVLGTALRQLGMIVVLILGGSALHIAWWVSLSFIAIGIAFFIRTFRTFPSSVLLRPKWNAEVIVRNRSFAANMAALTGLDALQQQIDKIVISLLLPLGYLGYYSFLYTTVGRSALVRAALGSTSLPALTELYAEGNRAKLIATHRKLLDIQAYAAIPLFAAIAFALKPLLSYTFSPAIAEELLVTGLLLITGFYLIGMNAPNYQLAIATGRPYLARKSSELAIWLTVPAAILLIYQYGITGAGYTLLIQSLFGYFYLVPRIYRECLDRPASDWYHYWPRPLVLGLSVYGLTLYLLFALERTSILGLAGAYALASALFAAIAYHWVDPALTAQFRRSIMFLRDRYFRRLLHHL